MRLTRLRAEVILGVLLPQIASLAVLTPDCLSTVDLCMSDLCRAKETERLCEEDAEWCQVRKRIVCNMSLADVLGQFPSLRACACEEKADLCDSIPALLAQCHQKPAAQWQRSSKKDWKLSKLSKMGPGAAQSCLENLRLCLGDEVCNTLMAPVLQGCMEPNCEHHRCQQATMTFYRGMPLHVGQLLVMCKCQDSDEACVTMSSALHSGTCGTGRQNCLQTARECVGDRVCRKQMSVFLSRCWRSVEPHCLNDLHPDECFNQMKPALILGAQSECQTAFLDTVGTSLHFPCTCEGLIGPDRLTCGIIHEVFHNRSHFIKKWMPGKAPTEPPSRSEATPFYLKDYLLSAVACLLLMGIATLAILIIIWRVFSANDNHLKTALRMTTSYPAMIKGRTTVGIINVLARRQKRNKLQSFQKSHSVIL